MNTFVHSSSLVTMIKLPAIAFVLFWSVGAVADICDYGKVDAAATGSRRAAVKGDIAGARAIIAKARTCSDPDKRHESTFASMTEDVDLADMVGRDVCSTVSGWRVSKSRHFAELIVALDPTARDELAAMLSAKVTADGAVPELSGREGAAGMEAALRKAWPSLPVAHNTTWTLQYTERSCIARDIAGLSSFANGMKTFGCDGSALLASPGVPSEVIALAGFSPGTSLATAARSVMPGSNQIIEVMQQRMLANAEQRLCKRPTATPLSQPATPPTAPPTR
jgi:hypothetical protein